MYRTAASALVVLAGALPVVAQQFPTSTDCMVHYDLLWHDTGNNNHTLEPGESADIRLDVSVTNQGGIAHFSPPIGTFTSGTILGFGTGFLDLVQFGSNQNGAYNLGRPPGGPLNNGSTGYGVRAGWRIVGDPGHGTVNPNGVASIQFGQFVASPSAVNTGNPIPRMWATLFTPASFGVTSGFNLLPSPLAGGFHTFVYVQLDATRLGAVSVAATFDSITTYIPPAPGSAVTLLLAGVLVRRRR